jgi:hypothetical protein
MLLTAGMRATRGWILGDAYLLSNMISLLNDCSLTDNRADKVVWAPEKKSLFTTKSMYHFLNDRGATSRVAGFIWRSKVPLKIKFFLWQLHNNKLQVAANLAKKGWKGDKSLLSLYLC